MCVGVVGIGPWVPTLKSPDTLWPRPPGTPPHPLLLASELLELVRPFLRRLLDSCWNSTRYLPEDTDRTQHSIDRDGSGGGLGKRTGVGKLSVMGPQESSVVRTVDTQQFLLLMQAVPAALN